ncbi:hypothetical protein GTW24_03820 [Vibrio cholerae]|nr:hypothetical protein [Vibrio cholerae]OFI77926.1 hypothetical protein BFX16_06360 [Vibrio cholerae]OFI78987.1 hypothetical protein BFX15_06395 [Vibrio cholerae]
MCESCEDSLLIQLLIFISTIRKRALSARFFSFLLSDVQRVKESKSLAFFNHPNFFGKAA